MSVVIGSVDPYGMLFVMAVVLVPFIGFMGWLIWRASMRRGLWILIVTGVLSAVIGWWRGPVWIWAVVFGAVLVSLLVEPDPPRPDSWWIRHKEARAAGKRDGAYYIIPALIAVLSIAPLLLVVVSAAMPEEVYPTATVEGVLQLSPEEPIGVVDIEVALSGGVAGEEARLGIEQSMPFDDPSGLRRGLGPTLVFPMEDGIVTDVVRTASVYNTLFVDLDSTCNGCSYRYRVVYSLDPTFEQSIEVAYGATFRWGADDFPPTVGAEELPEVTVTATAADVSPYRITSNVVTDDTQWTVERPFDLRMVTVDIDPALVPASGLALWPALERRATSMVRNSNQGDPAVFAIGDVKELDPSCQSAGCLQYSYIVPIFDAQSSLPAESLDFGVIHWIDYLDGTADDGAGSLRISSTAPGAWLEERNPGELQLESADDHIVTIDFDVDAAAGTGSGVATVTVSAPPGVDIKSVSPYPARGSRPFSLNECEARPPCSVSLIIAGNAGDRVTWNLHVAYGFFDVSDTPSGAHISFAPAKIEIRN